MARLKVFQNKKWISSLQLFEDKKVSIGRSRECDFVMEASEGISRKHVIVYKDRSGWIVERLSKIENLTYENQQVSKIHLKDNSSFQVSPYEFEFQVTSENTEVSESRDRTVVVSLPTGAFLRLSDQDGNFKKSYELQGSYWLGGREASSSVFIDSPHVSRKQFEIQKNEYGYQVRHLGSMNPTKLNGGPIGEEFVNIVSGDVISLGELRLLFEIRRSDVYEKDSARDAHPVVIEQIEEFNEPSEPVQVVSQGPVQFYEEAGGSFSAQQVYEAPEKSRITIYAIICLVLFVGIYAYMQNAATPPPPKNLTSKKDSTLSPEKLASAKQLYLTAQALLAQGKYELAKEQVQKLHQIVPQFEDSKEIETTALQGLSILADRERAFAEARDRAAVAEKLKTEIEKCRTQTNAHVEAGWMESCLTTASSLNPDAPEIAQLISTYNEKLTRIQMKKEEERERLGAIQRQMNLFAKADKLQKTGNEDDAIEVYNKVAKEHALNHANLPGEAKRRIASIEEKVISRQAEAEKEADDLYKKGDLKDSVQKLQVALKANSDNEVIRGKLDKYSKELSRKMKEIYQQSVLEESYGDVKAAKAKWQKITDESTPGESFYDKAKTKLKKYGDM